MFKLLDNRNFVYQWDTDVVVRIDDPRVKEAHFCNRTSDCSLVVEVKDGLANVPNIILQQNYDIKVFAFDGKATLFEQTIKVVGRTMPADYIYTETELVRYEDLNLRIDDLEENLESTVVEEVAKYLEENPIDVDLSDYYTKEEVDTAIENVEVDLTGYATEAYVNEAVKNVEVDLTGYATEEYVDNAIANIDIPEAEVDLSNYYTKTEVDNLLADMPSGGGGLTEEEVQDMIDASINSLGIAEEGEY